MSGEEVVDDAGGVVGGHGVQSGHPGEGERPDELTQREVHVEVVEFGAGFCALQDGVEGLSVLVDDACAQRAGRVFTAGVVGVCRSVGR